MPPPDLTARLPEGVAPLAAGVGAFLLTVALTPLVIGVARRLGWVAEPREDRWHERPTALMGGIAIFGGAIASWIAASGETFPWALLGGGTLLFLAGLADDLNGLSPVTKVVAQVASATLVLLAGWELAPMWPAWISVPLTYLWVIGITNAVNLLDNMDGLAAGISAIAAVTVAVLAGVAGEWSTAGPALAVSGAAGAFLIYNFPPARIFMGDSGALFLGFSVSALAIAQPGAGASGTAAVVAVPAALMAVPILDTTLVTLKRIVSGRPVTQGGKDHSSHRLVFLGLSERRAALTLYGVATVFCLLAVALRLFNVYLTIAVAALAAVALAVFGVFLSQVRTSSGDADAGDSIKTATDAAGRQRPVVLEAVLRNKREIAALLGDLLLVVGSFVIAHYLRYESGLSPEHADRMIGLLPAVVLLKIATLYGFGVYRGLLRFAGSHELLRVVKASTVASGVLGVALVLVFRFEGLSRSVYVIDWLVATLSLAAMRGAFRGLRSYFAARREGGRRVLLYGAGDAGFLALREIRHNPELDLEPVAFVDDDPAKQGRIVHGLEVSGGGKDLKAICRRREVEEVLLTISNLNDSTREEILRHCRDTGLPVREMTVGFRESESRAHQRRMMR